MIQTRKIQTFPTHHAAREPIIPTGYSAAEDLAIVVHEVRTALEVDLQALFSERRAPSIVLARGLISAIARKVTRSSYPEIARALCRPTHTTVIAAERRLLQRCEDPGVQALYDSIRQRIERRIEDRRKGPSATAPGVNA